MKEDYPPSTEAASGPPPVRLGRYLEIDVPDHFMFQFKTPHGTWMEEAVCLADHFTRNPDGSYVGSAGGSPIWFRCTEKHARPG